MVKENHLTLAEARHLHLSGYRQLEPGEEVYLYREEDALGCVEYVARFDEWSEIISRDAHKKQRASLPDLTQRLLANWDQDCVAARNAGQSPPLWEDYRSELLETLVGYRVACEDKAIASMIWSEPAGLPVYAFAQ